MTKPIYSWHDWQIAGVTPMHWVRCANDPVGEARGYLAACSSAGEPLPLMFWRPQDRAFDLDTLDLQAYFDGRFGHELLAAWTSTLFGIVASAGIEPPMLVLDYEQGISTWGQSKQRFLSEVRTLPAEITDLTADRIYNFPWDRNDVARYNRFCVRQTQRAIRKAIVNPARAAFGQPARGGYEMPISNYADARMSFAVPDFNGWPIEGDLSVAGWSSPACYLGGGGGKYAENNIDPVLGRLADWTSVVESCRQTSPRVCPWVSFPTFGGPAAAAKWPDLIAAIAPSSQLLLFWNALEGDIEQDRAIATAAFADL